MYQLDKQAQIAVFDSGVGGISVLRELVKEMPNENFLYFGDSIHAPYGTKTQEEVRLLTSDAAKALFDQGAKGLVVACNTATTAAVRSLREQYPYIPIVGIEPAVKPASTFKENPTVLVMATPMTIRLEKLQNLIGTYASQANIIPLSCPGLMDFVERGDLDGEDLYKYLRELLYEFKDMDIDAVVMGCTHYPFVGKAIKEVLGGKVQIFDGGAGTAREMKRRLKEANLLADRTEAGQITITNSLPSEEKLALCNKLLQTEIL